MAPKSGEGRLRFSLRHLLGAAVVCAFAFVAMAQANQVWVSVIATATMLVLLTTVLGIVYWAGAARAFAVGFTTWGCAYLMTVFFVLNGNAEVGGSGRLFTSQILARTHWRLWPLEEQWSQQNYGNPPNPAYEAHMWHYDSFMRIGQMFWSWLFGLLGGVLARWFYLRGRRQRELDPGRGVN